jgi:aryl-alcohol dehydrogenase-like predicted oxidoreductase
MQTRPLGAIGLRTSALGLGTAAIAVAYGAPRGERSAPDRAGAVGTVVRALERGIRFVDTAPAYGDAEAILGEAGLPPDCLVATKLAIPHEGWDALDGRTLRDHVGVSVETSLRALRRDTLDVLQVHNLTAADAAYEPLMAALEELRAAGTVRALGATVYGEDAALAALPAFDVVQVAMSPLDRRPERRVLPAATERGTAVVVRSSLLRGVLTSAGAELAGPFGPLRDAADAFRRAAAASWAELPGAAIAWALGRPSIACVLLGPRDAAELDQLLDGAAAFAGAVPDGDWGAVLDDDLLDPSRWPALEETR